jgi:hypothetical protein
MQLRLLPSALIFLGSYLPLAVILLAQDFQFSFIGRPLCGTFLKQGSGCELPLGHPVFSLAILFLCAASFVISLSALSAVRPKMPLEIVEAKYIPAELMSYTLPYVVSFMSIGYQEIGKFVGLVVFLAWMFWVTYKSGQLILNPVLVAFGWRLYEVSYKFPGDTRVWNGRALASGAIESMKTYPHAVVQDVIVVKVLKRLED